MEEFRGLVQFMERFDTEEKCREHLRSILYPQNPTCKCGCKRMYYFERRSFFGFRCHKCGFAKALSHNTMFKQSKLGLRKWFIAIYLFTVHDQGLTSVKLAELLDINKGSAWHLLHRIRKSLHHTNLNKKLCGIVEADETYIGGKKKGKTGRGSQNKKIVFGTIQRQGRVYAKVVANCGKQVLQPIIYKKVRKTTKIFTDYWAGYRNLEGYKHIRIKHKDGMQFTATIERFWGHVKTTIRTHRSVSKKHLQKYVDAVVFHYNTRFNSISEKFNSILINCLEVTTFRNLIDIPYVLD